MENRFAIRAAATCNKIVQNLTTLCRSRKVFENLLVEFPGEEETFRLNKLENLSSWMLNKQQRSQQLNK